MECATCRVKFTLRELNHYESTKEGRGQTPAVFAGSAVRCVLRLLGADAHLNDDLTALLLSGFRHHSGGDEIELEDVLSMRASMAGESVVANVCELAAILTSEQRQMLSRHLLDAAQCYRDKDISIIADDLREILAPM